jgi:hypothetical protein
MSRSGQYASRVARWFDRGVEAFQRQAPSAPRCYVCPLCGHGHTREAIGERVVTIEHVPPRSLGGRGMCLTCRDCNVGSGHTIDAHMRRYENSFEVRLGAMLAPRPATFAIGDAKVAVDYYHGGAGIVVMGRPNQNSPHAQAQFLAELERLHRAGSVPTSFQVALSKDGFDARTASAGWLRAAYLVGFSLFGYLYAFQSRLAAVRKQIEQPTADIIAVYSVTLPAATAEARRVLVCEEPGDLMGLAVQMGRHLVFLPWATDGLYDALAARAKAGSRVQETLRGRPFPWPRDPLHLLDFEQIPGIEVTRDNPSGGEPSASDA